MLDSERDRQHDPKKKFVERSEWVFLISGSAWALSFRQVPVQSKALDNQNIKIRLSQVLNSL